MPRPVALVAPTSLGAVAVVAIFAVWFLRSAAHAATDTFSDAIRERLPRYDPKIRDAHVAALDAAARQAAAGPEAYGVKQGSTEPRPTSDIPSEMVTLPRIVVHPLDGITKPEPTIQLPRLVIRPAGKDLPPDGFEAPAAREERLMKKHLSVFDRMFLNRVKLPPFFGTSNEKRARDAEAVEQSARGLNEISDLVELSDTGEPQSKEDRELKKAYLDAFVARPK